MRVNETTHPTLFRALRYIVHDNNMSCDNPSHDGDNPDGQGCWFYIPSQRAADKAENQLIRLSEQQLYEFCIGEETEQLALTETNNLQSVHQLLEDWFNNALPPGE